MDRLIMLLKKIILPFIILSIIAVAACTKAPERPLRAGTNVWPGYEPLYLAQSLSLFKKSSVKLVEYPSTTEVIRAFRSGDLEAAAVTLDEALLLSASGVDLRIVLVLDFSNGADALLARPSVKSIKELKGKAVGAETGALGAYVLARALEAGGLVPADIKIVPLSIDEQERAFNEGRVDAVVTFEPVRSRILRSGASVLFDSSKMPGEIIDVLVVRKEALAAEPEKVRELLDGWFSALEHIEKDPEDSYSRMHERLRTSPADIKRSFELMVFPSRQDNLDMFEGRLERTAGKLQAVMAERGLIGKEAEVKPLLDKGPVGGLE